MELGPRVAGPDVLEVATGALAVRNRHVAAQQQGGHELPAKLAIPVDLVGDQRPEDEGALRVADQHDAAAVAVLPQVGLPGFEDARVREAPLLRRDRTLVENRLQGELAIHRRINPALLGVAGRLVQGDRALLGIDVKVGVLGLLVADGWIDVEAVDLAVLRPPGVLHAEPLPGGGDNVVFKPRLQGLCSLPGLQSQAILPLAVSAPDGTASKAIASTVAGAASPIVTGIRTAVRGTGIRFPPVAWILLGQGDSSDSSSPVRRPTGQT